MNPGFGSLWHDSEGFNPTVSQNCGDSKLWGRESSNLVPRCLRLFNCQLMFRTHQDCFAPGMSPALPGDSNLDDRPITWAVNPQWNEVEFTLYVLHISYLRDLLIGHMNHLLNGAVIQRKPPTS